MMNLKLSEMTNVSIRQSHIKYLCILIDENLSWKHHTLELTKEPNRANSNAYKSSLLWR